MAFEWVNRVDGESSVLADDVNSLAHGIKNNQNKINSVVEEAAETKTLTFTASGVFPPGSGLSSLYYTIDGSCDITQGSFISILGNPNNTEYIIGWDGIDYQITQENVLVSTDGTYSVQFGENNDLILSITEMSAGYEYLEFITNKSELPVPPNIIFSSIKTGNRVNLIKISSIPDYVSKAYVDENIGDIESALDTIIAMQEALIGGDTV